jgi:hypothetical protein
LPSQISSLPASTDEDARRYAELGRYAVQLAVAKVYLLDPADRTTSCDVCLNVSDPGQPIQHDDSCLIGRIFALTAEIAIHKAPAPELTIEYFASMSAAGDLVPARTVTHEGVAREFDVPEYNVITPQVYDDVARAARARRA